MTEYRKIRIEIPCPGQEDGALVCDAETGQPLKCAALDLHIDHQTMQPVLTLTLLECEATIIGVYRCERILEQPYEEPDDE